MARTTVIASTLGAAVAVALGGYVVAGHLHQRGTLPDPIIQLGAEHTTLPMVLRDGRPIVELQINGTGPYAFILDTAAEGTVLSQELAKSLRLPVQGSARIGAPGGRTADATFVRVDRSSLEESI